MTRRIFALFICIAVLSTLIPTTSVAADEQNLYKFNFNEESALGELFSSGKSVSLEWVNASGIGHDDNTALRVVHTEGSTYISTENAVILNLPEPLPAGGVYRIVAWVYAPSDENQNKSTLTGSGFVLNDDYAGQQGTSKFPPMFGSLPLDEWKAIDVTLPLQTSPISRLDFRIVINDEPNHPDVWYWDNIEIYQIGELEEVVVTEENPVTDLGYPLITRNKHETYDGFDYELWSQRSTDPVTMILTGGGTYQCTWDAENILFRTGKKLGSTTTYQEFGNISLEYAADYNITSGDVSYLCMYGWTLDPMIEFYIVENYGNYKPPGGVGFLGTYELDGSTYEVYTDTRVEKPSIHGTKTFEQYFSVRTNKRSEGTMSISEHFKEWENMGLDMSGVMYEVSLCVEGYNSSGNANVYKHLLTVGDDVYGELTELSHEIENNEEDFKASGDVITDEAVVTNEAAIIDEADQSVVPASAYVEDHDANGYDFIIIIVLAIIAVGAGIIIFVRKRGRK